MSPAGRPKAEHPKDIKFSIRLDQGTYERLEQYCEKHTIRKAQAIRQAIEMLISSGS